MKLIETTITGTSVRMRYADHEDAAKATQWVDFQVPISELHLPSETALGDPEPRSLALVRLAALRYARDVIGSETQRLSNLVNRSF
ncbi:hypothetical protein [Rhodomicrobium udaipurense]|uniref:Uncharacterized protein n=1 Tax=Rhodomicrobium udaipurense TaxID=1202716 RepID=A0A8I1KG34_9HYPH|nr:hypothetical protein [Rhodomicrobium udaipurense]MBJ7542335.1 hypothetical protein [Rhodomicrobium udaipurense]